jgi:hypothetical protein
VRLTRGTTTEAAYWTAAQLVTHHTVNGCNLQPGDLLLLGASHGAPRARAGQRIEIGIEGHTHHSHRPKGYDLRLVVQLFNCELDFIYVESSSTAVCRHLGKFLFV